jgi:o-succinylbenzoate---CoA ligase
LRAVLVDRPTPRLTELLAAALDGTGPAIAPVDAALPAARLAELLKILAPDEVEGADGVRRDRSARRKMNPDTAVIVCTSGSTGAPKGVQLSAGALVHSARASLARTGARPGERWLCCLPVSHVAGLQVLVRSLVGGTEPVLAGRANLQTIADACAAGCRHVSLVPTQLTRLLGTGLPGAVAGGLAGFRSVLLGGAAASGRLLEQARGQGVPVITTYGMTETCGGCVYDGLPLDGVRVEVAEDGRIWLGGPVLFSGYLGEDQPPAAACRIERATDRPGAGVRWFRTGDLGAVGPDGGLVVLGRADDMINTGGHKVAPGEVQAVLAACPGVADVAVVGQSHPEWGEQVVAVVVPADKRDPPALEVLRMQVEARLPRYAAPSRVVLVDAVPLLPSGKPDLEKLRRALDVGTNGRLKRYLLVPGRISAEDYAGHYGVLGGNT